MTPWSLNTVGPLWKENTDKHITTPCEYSGALVQCQCCHYIPRAVVIHLQDASVTQQVRRQCNWILLCLPECNIWCALFCIGARAESHTYHRLNNGDIDQASAAGSGHRNGLLRRHSQFNHTAVSSCNTWPQTHKVTGVKWALRAARQSVVCAVLYLRSWCGCRWADPWLSSSGSPAETLPDLHAPAVLCQSRTGGTM